MIGPSVGLVRRTTTPWRFVVMALSFGAPLALLFALLLAAPKPGVGTPVLVVIGSAIALPLYLIACWHVVSSAGFRGLDRAIERLGSGDLRQDSDRSNGGLIWSLAYQLRDAGDSLARSVAEIRASAGEIDVQARALSAGYADLSRRAGEQATTLEQTASGMEELSATVKGNAATCERADEHARAADAIASQGAPVVHRTVECMALIEKSSRKIGDIVAVIEGIAFQTNILALNAAVEAARAGEQGKGFAVVASEVRMLAQRSADAAREIRALIERSSADVREGGKLVAATGGLIDGIVAGVRKVKVLMAEVATASKEQSSSVEAIARAIAQMEGVTRQNTELVTQVSAATMALEEGAARLTQSVSRFRIVDDTHSTAAPSRRASIPRPAPRPTPVPRLAAASPLPLPRREGRMARILIAPGMAILGLFSTPTRMIFVAALFDATFAAALYSLVAAGTPWTHPAVLVAIAILTFANWQQFCHYLVVKEGFPELGAAIKRIATGDLGRRGTGNSVGEVKSFAGRVDVVSEHLAEMFAEVQASSEAIGAESRQIADAHTSLAQRNEEQASALEETAAGMEEVSATVKANADACAHAAGLARNSDAVANQGAQTVHRAVERMGLLEQSSRRVVDIIAVIEGIAFQTNILALNAAVEAARAGDQGRGFAVVASEVRGLAQRSAEAAREIRALIEESAANVAEGGKLVAEAGTIINEIVGGVSEVKELIDEVAHASKEQSHGVEEVRRAVARMESVTRQDANLVEKASSASAAFDQAAQRLTQALGRFRST